MSLSKPAVSVASVSAPAATAKPAAAVTAVAVIAAAASAVVAPVTKSAVPAIPATSVPATPAVATAASVAAQSPLADLSRDLRSPSAEIAKVAATALGNLTDTAAIDTLLDVVRNPDGYFHGTVRAAACASLGRLKDRRAVPALIHAVRDPIAETSSEAVRALSAIGDERTVEPLITVLKNERNYYLPTVRVAAASALRQFKNPAAIAALKALPAGSPEETAARAA